MICYRVLNKLLKQSYENETCILPLLPTLNDEVKNPLLEKGLGSFEVRTTLQEPAGNEANEASNNLEEENTSVPLLIPVIPEEPAPLSPTPSGNGASSSDECKLNWLFIVVG